MNSGWLAPAGITALIVLCRTWKMWSEIMHVSRECLWEMWWVSTAGLDLIRESSEWQQPEWLSKVAMRDLFLQHQAQPNSSPYLQTVLLGGLVLFYLLFSSLLSSLLPHPFPLGGTNSYFCWLTDDKMSPFVTLFFSFHFLWSRSALLIFQHLFFRPLKRLFMSFHLFNTNYHLLQAGSLFETYACCFCWSIQAANLLKPSFRSPSCKRSLMVFIVQYSMHALWLSTEYNTTSRLLSNTLPLSTNHLAECEVCFSGGNHYRAS